MKLAPLFDHGLSLVFSCYDNEDAVRDFDVMKDYPVNNYFFTRSLEYNLRYVPKSLKINQLHDDDYDYIMHGIDMVLPKVYVDKMWGLSNDTWGAEELNATHSVIDSRFFTMAKKVKQYEKIFAEKFGSKYAIMSNSGSSANLLTMAALLYSGRLKRGDEILVTAVSWSTTYFPISQMGFKIRFVDINIETLNVDAETLEKAITPATRAVMLVNLLGNPNAFDAIQAVCDKHNLLLLEDNCESMGATYNGKMAGTFGLIGSFSTYFSHHLCTMEGGMNVTDDEELYHYMLSIRSHGWTRHLPKESSIYTKLDDPFYESFNFIMPGFNVRPLEIEAATGIEQLNKLDDFIEQRRKNAILFKESIESETDFLTQKEIGKSSWFGFAIILPARVAGSSIS